MIANQLFYRVLNDRTIIVAAARTQKRTQYEEQVIRTFFVSHADATELSQLLVGLIRVAGMAIQPQIVANKTTNTITIRATAPSSDCRRVIDANDKPRAEVMVDVQILEVIRERAKNYGLRPGQLFGGVEFLTGSGAVTEGGGAPFNLNTISGGVSNGRLLPLGAVRGGAVPRKRLANQVAAKPNCVVSRARSIVELAKTCRFRAPPLRRWPLRVGSSPLDLVWYRTSSASSSTDAARHIRTATSFSISRSRYSARGPGLHTSPARTCRRSSRARSSTKLRLRDGESNLLAGCCERMSASTTGFRHRRCRSSSSCSQIRAHPQRPTS